MKLSSIVALADNLAIGIDNQLPWHLPNDLKFFKKTTLGKPILMGRKTFESLGKPLPGRLNIVVSQNKYLVVPDGVEVVTSIENGIELMEATGIDEGFIIGGGLIFEATLSLIDRLYLTKVHTTIESATTFFPAIDHAHWKLVWEENHTQDDKHAFDFTFQQLERIDL